MNINTDSADFRKASTFLRDLPRRSALIAAFQHEISEWQKSDQRHVVCQNHGSGVSDHYERKDRITDISDMLYYASGQKFEYFNIPERANDQKRAKQTTERAEIEIPYVFLVERYEKTSDRSGNERKPQHHVLQNEFFDAHQYDRSRMVNVHRSIFYSSPR